MPSSHLSKLRSNVGLLVLALAPWLLLGSVRGEGGWDRWRIASEETRVEPNGEGFDLWTDGKPSGRLTEPPRRVASLTVSSDEILDALDQRDRVAAASALVDDPDSSLAVGAYPASLPRLWGEVEPVLAVQPDLVVVSAYARLESLSLFLASGLPIYRVGRVATFPELRRSIQELGRAVDAEDEASALVADLDERLEAIAERVRDRPSPRVLFVSVGRFTAGTGTLLDEIIRRAGGTNVAAEIGLRGTAPLSLEMAISLQAEALVAVRGSDGGVFDFREDPRWSSVPAVAEGRILELPLALALSTSHHAVETVERVAHWLHPELPKEVEAIGGWEAER